MEIIFDRISLKNYLDKADGNVLKTVHKSQFLGHFLSLYRQIHENQPLMKTVFIEDGKCVKLYLIKY